MLYKKVPITEKDIKWCHDILSKYEPFPDEKVQIIFNENLLLYINGIITSETYEHYKSCVKKTFAERQPQKLKKCLRMVGNMN